MERQGQKLLAMLAAGPRRGPRATRRRSASARAPPSWCARRWRICAIRSGGSAASGGREAGGDRPARARLDRRRRGGPARARRRGRRLGGRLADRVRHHLDRGRSRRPGSSSSSRAGSPGGSCAPFGFGPLRQGRPSGCRRSRARAISAASASSWRSPRAGRSPPPRRSGPTPGRRSRWRCRPIAQGSFARADRIVDALLHLPAGSRFPWLARVYGVEALVASALGRDDWGRACRYAELGRGRLAALVALHRRGRGRVGPCRRVRLWLRWLLAPLRPLTARAVRRAPAPRDRRPRP